MNTRTSTPLLAVLLLALATALVPAQNPREEPAGPPPPEKKTDEFGLPLVTVRGSQLPSTMVSAQIKDSSGINVIFKGKAADQKINVIAEDEPIITVLNKIIAGKDWEWYREGDVFEVMDRATYESTVLPPQVREMTLVPENIKATLLAASVKGMLNAKIGETVTADDRTNKLFLRALPQTLEAIQKYVREIDKSFITRVFRIRNADPNVIKDKISPLKSEPGTIDVDEVNHTIVVRDQFRNIRRMEILIDVYDKKPEMRVYQLRDLRYQGTNYQDTLNILERIITPNAFMEINPERGLLVLEDVPEVHDRVAKLLSVFDEPVKQAMIHAEVIQTNFTRGFNYGLSVQASRDLFGAVQDNLFPTRSGAVTNTTNFNAIPLAPAILSNGTAGTLKSGIADLGFTDLAKEFPTLTMGGSGVTAELLTKYAHYLFNTAMSNSETRVLSQPRILVQNQGHANLKVGGTKAYRTVVRYGSSVSNDFDRSQAQRPFGLVMDINLSITYDNVCELDLQISNTDAIIRGDANADDPLIDTADQDFQTVLRIPSGETKVLGGLISTNDTKSKGGTPFLSQIPYIGGLFGSKSDSNSQNNLLIFITPVVIEDEARKRRSAVAIDDVTRLLSPEEEGEATGGPPEAMGGPPLQEAASDRLRQYMEEIQRAKEGPGEAAGPGAGMPPGMSPGMSAGAETLPSEAPGQEDLPPAVPAATPETAPPQMAPSKEEMTTSDALQPPAQTPPPPQTQAPPPEAPLVSGPLEPLPRADLTTSETQGAKEAPQSSYVYHAMGAPAPISEKGTVTGPSAAPAARPSTTAKRASHTPAAAAASRTRAPARTGTTTGGQLYPTPSVRPTVPTETRY